MSDPQRWEFVFYALFGAVLIATLAWHDYRARRDTEEEEGGET